MTDIGQYYLKMGMLTKLMLLLLLVFLVSYVVMIIEKSLAPTLTEPKNVHGLDLSMFVKRKCCA